MRLKIFIVLLVTLGLVTACQPVATQQVTDSVPSATPVFTATATAEALPTQTFTPEPTPTATLAPTPDLSPDLDCGETFCSAAWPGVLARPIGPEGTQTIDPTYPYASTRNGTLEPHHGVEFPNGAGTPVLAAQAGEVVFAGQDDLTVLGPYTGFYGNVVIVRHAGLFEGRDLYTLYAHLSEMDVSVGDLVSTGQMVGKVGMTGAADGAHLHFEVRLDENDYDHTTNPILWLAPLDLNSGGEGAALAGLLLDEWEQPIDQFSFSLERLNPDGSLAQRYYPITYYPAGVNANPITNENFAVTDLPPGDYRLAYISNGYQQVTFTLTPGSLGFIKLPPE